jgi:hypothetical protein
MKPHFFPIAIFLFLFASCGMEDTQNKEVVDALEETQQDGITTCGVADPAKNLPWLADLIAKAESAKTSGPHNPGDDYHPINYLGQIWLEKYKGRDLFVTNMMLGSGGVAYWFFDCEGNHLTWKSLQNETCPACQYVGNHHFMLEDDELEGFESFALKMKREPPIYSPF